jgi:hypothetical protein
MKKILIWTNYASDLLKAITLAATAASDNWPTWPGTTDKVVQEPTITPNTTGADGERDAGTDS